MSTFILVLFSLAVGWLLSEKIGGNLIAWAIAFFVFWWMFGKLVMLALFLLVGFIIVKSLTKGR